MIVDCYISNEFDRRAEKKMFEDIIYQLQEFDSEEKVWVIGNIELVDTQLDMLLIKKNCLTIIEMKNFKGEVKGSENDEWKVKNPNGTVSEIGKNLFQQVKNQRYSLREKIKNIIENGALSKFEGNLDAFYNTDAWLCFNNGSKYDRDQIPHDALNWFRVTTVESLPDKIASTDSSGAYLLSEEDIDELLDSLSAKPYVLEEENDTLVKDKWAEVEVHPDDWETAKRANQTYEKVLEKIKDEELKHICRHGIALTSKKYEEALKILLDLYETPDYDGYKNNDLKSDILIEYLKWDPPKDKKWDELEKIVDEIFSHLKEERNIEKIRDIYLESQDGLFETPYENQIYVEMGKLLTEEYPNDIEVLKRMVEYYSYRGSEEEFLETTKKLLENKIGVEDLLDFIIGAEFSFFPIKDFERIIEYLDKEDELSAYKPKFETLIDFYEMKLRTSWEDLSENKKQEILEKIENGYQGMINENEENCSSLYKIIRWYDRWDEFDKAKEYAPKIVNKNQFELKEQLSSNQILFLIDFFEKLGEESDDYSYLHTFLEKGLEMYPNDLKINTKAGKFYEEQNQFKKAIKHYELALKKSEKIGTNKQGISFLEKEKPLHNWADFRYDSLPKNTFKTSSKVLGKNNKETYDLLRSEAKFALNSLVELHFENGDYKKAYDICEWLKNQNIQNVERYIAPHYHQIGDHLLEEYSEYLEEDEPDSKKTRKIDYSLDDLAISPDLEKKIDYLLHKMQNKRVSDSILFYGPPGTGKTEIAKGIAGEQGWDIIEITSEVLDKWYGETEKNIRQKFEEARKGGGTVLIIDELEYFGQDRREQDRSHELSRSREMLTQINKTLKEGNQVLIIGITNYLERVDLAIKRKGRFNRKIKIGKPNKKTRKEIFEIKLSSLEASGVEIADELDLNKFANKSKGMTGADIHNIVHNQVDEILFHKEGQELVTDEIVLEAIESVKDEKEEEKKGMRYTQ